MPKTTEKQKFKDSKTKHSKGEMPTRQNLTEAFCLLQNVKDEFYFDFRQRQPTLNDNQTVVYTF